MAENLFLSCVFFFFLSLLFGFLFSYKYFLAEESRESKREVVLFDEDLYKKVSEVWRTHEKDILEIRKDESIDLFEQRLFPVILEDETEKDTESDLEGQNTEGFFEE